ncbi:S53 family peptidase [Streptomyces sp. NPDC004270]
MTPARIRVLLVALTAVVAAAAPSVSFAGTPSESTGATASTASTANVTPACGAPSPGFARCFSLVRTDIDGGRGVRGPNAAGSTTATATTLPSGYGPADLDAAYNLPGSGGADQTVAVVDAGDDPKAEADLAVYRQTYGLPPCTTANGCFHKVNQRGQSAPLPVDRGWGVEISLDLDMVSAACPDCHILLVEGDDASVANLSQAVDTAVALGATEVSNSYGTAEGNGLQSYSASYAHPGVAITVSSGDYGYGVPNWPADLTSVTAVGGTSLSRAGNARGWTEQAWGNPYGGAGSGCSAWIDKPAWQTDQNCPGRMVADVAAVADPLTGPAVYDSYGGYAGWLVIGGTSASAPYIAGVIALAGNPERYADASYFYGGTAGLNDVVGGTNAERVDCGGDYQCNGVTGYDGPTGNGSPNGLAAF